MTEGNGTMPPDRGNFFQDKSDPKDIRITGLIKDHVFSGNVGKDMMQKSYELQLQYYKDSLAHLNDSSYLYKKNQEILKGLAKVTNSTIVKGEEWLDLFPKGSPVLALMNHFSAYKLTSIKQSDLGLNIDKTKLGEDIPPPPFHFSSAYPVAEKLGNDLYDAHLELPDELGVIQQAGGFIGVATGMVGQFESTLERTKEHIEKYPNSLTVIFPEGGTSGKRNEAGPFDMLPFRKGPFSIAARLGLPIVPIAQYFNPNSGFELAVFEPIHPKADLSLDEAAQLAQETQAKIQTWLDERKTS